jgi:hypothetical protein
VEHQVEHLHQELNNPCGTVILQLEELAHLAPAPLKNAECSYTNSGLSGQPPFAQTSGLGNISCGDALRRVEIDICSRSWSIIERECSSLRGVCGSTPISSWTACCVLCCLPCVAIQSCQHTRCGTLGAGLQPARLAGSALGLSELLMMGPLWVLLHVGDGLLWSGVGRALLRLSLPRRRGRFCFSGMVWRMAYGQRLRLPRTHTHTPPPTGTYTYIPHRSHRPSSASARTHTIILRSTWCHRAATREHDMTCGETQRTLMTDDGWP